MKEEDEEEESAEGHFPLREGGKKQPREDTFEKKKDIFLLCWVTMKSVHF